MDRITIIRILVFFLYSSLTLAFTTPGLWLALFGLKNNKWYWMPVSILLYIPVPAFIFSLSPDFTSFSSAFYYVLAVLVIACTITVLCMVSNKPKIAWISFIPVFVIMAYLVVIVGWASITM